MTLEPATVDVSDLPDVARLAREVARDGRPRVLPADSCDLAVLTPTRRRRRLKGKRVTQSDIDRVMALAGAWNDLVDAEQLKRDLDAARSDNTPPVEL